MAGTDREIDPAEFEPDPYFDEDTADEIHRYHFASDGECDIILVPDYIERGGHYRGYTLEWSELFVSSKVMSAHSPVFRAMFNGPWKESQKVSLDAPGICRLPKDPDKALRQLCYVMHWPDTPIDPFMDIMDLELMREFVILCDKYDCVKIAKNLGSNLAIGSDCPPFKNGRFLQVRIHLDHLCNGSMGPVPLCQRINYAPRVIGAEHPLLRAVVLKYE